jgi:hypothetical protein
MFEKNNMDGIHAFIISCSTKYNNNTDSNNNNRVIIFDNKLTLANIALTAQDMRTWKCVR